jgi:hypothetical protein
MSLIRLAFGFIDGGVGSCVEDHIGLSRAHGSADRVSNRQITLRTVEGDDLPKGG